MRVERGDWVRIQGLGHEGCGFWAEEMRVAGLEGFKGYLLLALENQPVRCNVPESGLGFGVWGVGGGGPAPYTLNPTPGGAVEPSVTP